MRTLLEAAQVRRRPRAPWLAAVALVLAALTWQVQNFKPHVGVDNSWAIALHLAAVHGLDYGRDVVFTYGPLGFLSEPLIVSQWTGSASFGFALVAQVALAAVVFASAARVYGRLLAAGLTFAALGLSLVLSDV